MNMPTMEVTPEMQFLLQTSAVVQREFAHYLNGPRNQGYGPRAAWTYVKICAHPAEKGGAQYDKVNNPDGVTKEVVLGILRSNPFEWWSTNELETLTKIKTAGLGNILGALKKNGYITSRPGTKDRSKDWSSQGLSPIDKLKPVDLKLYNLIKDYPHQKIGFYTDFFIEEYPIGTAKKIKDRLRGLKQRGIVRSLDVNGQASSTRTPYKIYEVIEVKE